MGLLSYFIVKKIQTSSAKSIINAVGSAAANVVTAKENAKKENKSSNSSRSSYRNNIESKASGGDANRIKPPRSSAEYHGMNALLVAKELSDAGFINITLKPQNVLREKSKKYGEVWTVTVSGSEFAGVKSLSQKARIVIEYWDFRTNASEEAYARVDRIIPGKYIPYEEYEEIEVPEVVGELNCQVVNSSLKRFCAYCGNPIAYEGARFCTVCGREV